MPKNTPVKSDEEALRVLDEDNRVRAAKLAENEAAVNPQIVSNDRATLLLEFIATAVMSEEQMLALNLAIASKMSERLDDAEKELQKFKEQVMQMKLGVPTLDAAGRPMMPQMPALFRP